MPRVLWTPAELQYLADHYLEQTAEEMASAIGRTKRAVFRRLQILSLRQRGRWSREEDRRLTLLWMGTDKIEDLSKRLGRSSQSICRRAKVLGLAATKPSDSYEFLSEAAKRVGYSRSALIRILRWAEVPIHTARSHVPSCANTGKRRAYRQKYVDAFDADEAVTRWVRTATITDVAEEYGINPSSLRRHLRKRGVLPRGRVTVADQRIDPVTHKEVIEDIVRVVKLHWRHRDRRDKYSEASGTLRPARKKKRVRRGEPFKRDYSKPSVQARRPA